MESFDVCPNTHAAASSAVWFVCCGHAMCFACAPKFRRSRHANNCPLCRTALPRGEEQVRMLTLVHATRGRAWATFIMGFLCEARGRDALAACGSGRLRTVAVCARSAVLAGMLWYCPQRQAASRALYGTRCRRRAPGGRAVLGASVAAKVRVVPASSVLDEQGSAIGPRPKK